MLLQLCLIGVLITSVCLANLGFGKQSWNESSNYDTSRFSSWIWVSTLLNIIGLGFVKLSIAFFLLRIFERRYCRHLLYAIICKPIRRRIVTFKLTLLGLLFALTLAWFGTTLFQCVPVTAAWNASTQSKARCMSQSTHKTLSLVNNCNASSSELRVYLLTYAHSNQCWHRFDAGPPCASYSLRPFP